MDNIVTFKSPTGKLVTQDEYDPRWVIREDSLGDLNVFHECDKRKNCGCHGWLGGFDMAVGICHHCSERVPESFKSIWLVANTGKETVKYYAFGKELEGRK